MINDKSTMKQFGYSFENLSRGSKRKIIATCDDCNKERAIPKYAYRDLCASCAGKKRWTDDCREQKRIACTGSSNHFFGKQHTTATKSIISQKNLGKGDLPAGESAKYKVISTYKRRAKNRSLTFNLPSDEIDALLNGHCHYCGKTPGNICKHGKGNGVFVYNGIDRKNNDIGYESENCVSCCGLCNMSKRHQCYEDFLNWVAKVYEWRIRIKQGN